MWFFFQISKSLKNTPNHYPELEIWLSCLLLWAGISNFRFRIVIWSNLFWRFEKRISLSEKKPPLTCSCRFLLSNNLSLLGLLKFRFSQKATKIWCNLTEGLDITVEFGDKELFVHRKIGHSLTYLLSSKLVTKNGKRQI